MIDEKGNLIYGHDDNGNPIMTPRFPEVKQGEWTSAEGTVFDVIAYFNGSSTYAFSREQTGNRNSSATGMIGDSDLTHGHEEQIIKAITPETARETAAAKDLVGFDEAKFLASMPPEMQEQGKQLLQKVSDSEAQKSAVASKLREAIAIIAPVASALNIETYEIGEYSWNHDADTITADISSVDKNGTRTYLKTVTNRQQTGITPNDIYGSDSFDYTIIRGIIQREDPDYLFYGKTLKRCIIMEYWKTSLSTYPVAPIPEQIVRSVRLIYPLKWQDVRGGSIFPWMTP
jgi:hypothetical protein